MAKSEPNFSTGVTQGVVASFVYTVLAFVVVTLLSRFVADWKGPVLWGMFASLMACITALLLVAIARLNRGNVTSTKNVEHQVLTWLTRFSFTMKKDSASELHFRFIVTTASDRKVTIIRSKDEYAEYLTMLGVVGLSDEEVRVLDRLTQKQSGELLASVKRELSRARMGYAGLDTVAKFTIFKRVPIGPDLNVDRFIEAINEMEAVLNAVFQTGIIAAIRADLIPPKSEIKSEA